MANFTIQSPLGSGINSSKFFQTGDGGSLLGFSATGINVQNPDGTIVSITGTGFVLQDIGGGEMAPTAGTISDITLYQADFATQLAGFSNLSVGAAALYTAWQVDLVNVFNLLLSGADGVNGSAGNDLLPGGAGDDTINGFDGNDTIEPGAGSDTVDGGAGQNRVRYSNEFALGGTKGITAVLNGTVTDPYGSMDVITNIQGVFATNQADTLTGGDAPLSGGNAYEIYALDGNDTIVAGAFDLYTEPGAGNDSITGGAGFDQVSYAEYSGDKGATFNLPSNLVIDPYGGTDTLSGSIEGVRGTKNADVMIGNGLDNFFRGLAGADSIDGGSGIDQVRYDRDAQYGGNGGVVVDLAVGTAKDGFGNIDTLISIENVRGGAQADTLLGSAGNNNLQGLAGADLIDGRGGNDTVDYQPEAFFGTTKGVTVDLAAGTATDGFGATDTLVSIEIVRGTQFADTLKGGNLILSGTDVYVLHGLGGDDTLIAGSYDSLLQPGAGNDTVTGGAGFDQISYEDYTGSNGAVINLATGIVNDPFGGTDTVSLVEGIRGTRNDDVITGNAGNNFIRGLGGADAIDGGDGIDMVRYDRDAQLGGGAGVTVNLLAGTATDGFGKADTLKNIEQARGTASVDTLSGDDGNNMFQGLGGADTIDGRGGIDAVDYTADSFVLGITGVTVDLQQGFAIDGTGAKDTLISIEIARGSNGADTLIGNAFGNGLIGFAGNDILVGLGGNDTLDGGAGLDTASYAQEFFAGATKGVTVNLATGSATDGFGGTDTLTNIEVVTGTQFADTLTGGNAVLAVGDVYILNGGDGDDILTAGSYDALISPGGGKDAVKGGAGFDQISYENAGGTKGVDINLANGTALDPFGFTDTVSLVEGVRGTKFADTLTGDGASFNFYRGLAGDDIIDGGAGTDEVRYDRDANGGGNGNITVDLAAGKATDGFGNTDTLISIENVRGSNNNDDLRGDAFNNRIQPMGGADFVDGRGGQDQVDYSNDALAAGTLGVTINLATGKATDASGFVDELVSIEAGRGSSGADLLIGGDTLLQGQAWELYGVGGDDTIKAGAFDSYIEPGAGNDTITGGAGFDQVSYSEYTGTKGVDANLGSGIVLDPYGGKDTITGGIEALRGTRNADVLIGNDFNNQFRSLNGSDFINGGGGLDRVRYDRDANFGGSKGVVVDLNKGTATDGFGNADTLISIEQVEGTNVADTLIGGDAPLGPGASYELYGRGGDDILTGGAYSVYIEPGAGNDAVTGGAGSADQISYADFNNGVGVVLDLGKGSVVDPLGGTDTFTGIENARGTSAADTITGDAGANQILGTRGADKLDGGGGIDLVRYDRDANAGGKAAVTVNLALGTATDGFGDIDTLANFEDVRGSNVLAGDMLTGDGSDNRFQGLNGADVIDGGAGSDTADYGRDIADGGAAGVTVNLGSAGLGKGTATDGYGSVDTLLSIENVIGTGFADTITGDGAANMLQGGLGDDIIDGAGGDDTAVFSGASAGYTVTTGPGGVVTVTGADGKDTLTNVEALKFSDTTVSLVGGTYSIAPVSASLAEGTGSGSTAFTFLVQRSGSTAGTGTVAFSVSGSGAAPASAADFAGGVLPSGKVSFAAGVASQTVTINVARDSAPEANEGFQVALSSPTGGSIGTGIAAGTILNDDTSFAIATTSANKPEGSGAAGATTPFTFTVTRSGAAGAPQTVAWSVAGVAGTGTQPADAADFAGGVLPSGVVTFAPGEASRVISVPVVADGLGESNDRFTVTLGAPSGGGVLGTAAATGIIQNDDTSLRVVAGGAMAQTEGNSGARAYSFVVQRQGIVSGVSTVQFAVSGTGAAPANVADFVGGVLPAGTLTFLAGETSKTVTVQVAGDTVQEADEGFRLVLSNAAKATISGASLDAVIQSDDSTLSIAAASANKPEGTGTPGATTPFTFTVTRAGATGVAQSAKWSVAGVTGSGTQPADALDFPGAVLPGGVVTFAAGQTKQTVTVNVAADAVGELAERFAVTLSSPTNGAVLGTAVANGIIQNDDTSLRVVAGGAMTQTEGNTGPRAYSFVVQRQGNTAGSSTVDYAVTGSGAAPADAADFGAFAMPSGTLTFAPGETSKTVVINVTGDTEQEADEGFQFTLSNATGAAISGASLPAVIQSDDSTLSILAASANKPEGTGAPGATTQYTFTVTRTGALGVSQGVSFAVAGAVGNGTAPATAPDFGTGVFPTGSIGFAPGQATRTITVNVRADEAAELNERFAVTLSNPTGGAQLNADPAKNTANGIILNDDVTLGLTSATANQMEGDAGSRTYTFTVTRNGTGGSPTVNFAVEGVGSFPATGSDFVGGVLPSGTITFGPTQTSRTVTVLVAGDTAVERTEDFRVVLSNPVGAKITTASMTRSILSDDGLLTITPVNATRFENEAGGLTPFTFLLTRTGGDAIELGAVAAVQTVDEPGITSAGSDFGIGALPSMATGLLVGQTSRVISITVADDSGAEGDEHFDVALLSPSPGTQVGGPARGIIRDDESLYSGPGVPTLLGTAGNDLFILGPGSTVSIVANSGADEFRFLPSAVGGLVATVEDFTPGDGDVIDLSRIDAIAGTLADDAFSFNPTQGAGFSGAGSLVWSVDGTRVAILGDTNGDFAADITIFVRPVATPDATWFVL
jgi:Ca2+-binding RTX toxin-like protein